MKYYEFIKSTFLNKKVISILSLILLTFSQIMLFTIIKSGYSVYEGYNSLKKLQENHVYLGNDQSTDEQFKRNFNQQNMSNSNKTAKEFLSYMDKNYKYAISWSTSSSESLDNFSLQLKTISEDYNKFYNLTTRSGRFFTHKDFITTSSIIPVVIGSKLANKYKLGETFTLLNTSNNVNEKYKVIGVLDNNSSITSVYNLDTKNYLNFAIIRPFRDIDVSKINILQLSAGFQDLLIYDSEKIKVNDLSSLAKKDDFFNMKFYSIDENIKEFFELYKTRAITLAIFTGILLLITCLLIIWNTINSVESLKFDLSIRSFLGLSFKDIKISLCIYKILLFMISAILTFIYFIFLKFKYDSLDTSETQIIYIMGLTKIDYLAFLTTFFLVALPLIFSFVLSIWKIKKIPLTLRMISD
ncbi:ABC transporter permease [Priestia megaterium]